MISYVIYAMQRTGQHAIINWITGQADGSVTHVNFGQFIDGKIIPKFSQVTHVKKDGPRKFFITNVEDCNLQEMQSVELSDFSPLGESEKIVEILVVRDTRNWLASVLVGAKRDVDYVPPEVMAPKLVAHRMHASEYKGETNYIKNKVIIVYDWWFQSVGYRKEIAERLELPFTDEGLNAVSAHGQGSSFDYRNYHGRAQEMDVLNRWKVAKDDADYQKYMSMIEDSVIEIR